MKPTTSAAVLLTHGAVVFALVSVILAHKKNKPVVHSASSQTTTSSITQGSSSTTSSATTPPSSSGFATQYGTCTLVNVADFLLNGNLYGISEPFTNKVLSNGCNGCKDAYPAGTSVPGGCADPIYPIPSSQANVTNSAFRVWFDADGSFKLQNPDNGHYVTMNDYTATTTDPNCVDELCMAKDVNNAGTSLQLFHCADSSVGLRNRTTGKFVYRATTTNYNNVCVDGQYDVGHMLAKFNIIPYLEQ